MSKECAYCESLTNKITKEHVINKAFLNSFYKIGLSYAKCYDKITENFLTIRDVCDVCNNLILSDYDEYFLNFYKKHFTENVLKQNDTYQINYNYNKLSKWLLKTSYNSERKNSYESIKPVLHNLKDYIINDNFINNNFAIYIELLSDFPEEKIIELNKQNKSLTKIPEKLIVLKIGTQFFKKGVTESAKYIISSNFAFHIFTDFDSENKIEEKAKLYQEIAGISNFFRLEPNKEQMTLKASNRNLIDLLAKSYQGNKTFTETFSPYFDLKK